jgi:hypothetical protein
MDKFVLHVLQAELVARCPEISLFVLVSAHIAVYTRYHHVSPNIELTLVYQQGIRDVLLYDAGFAS